MERAERDRRRIKSKEKVVAVRENEGVYFVVAGDEMQKLMCEKFPDRKTVPFREDFSKGEYSGFSFSAELVCQRADFWGVSQKEYAENLSPIIGLDLDKNYALCFGDDACCRANLAFMIGYLRGRGYSKPIQVQIVNEYTLALQKAYWVQ